MHQENGATKLQLMLRSKFIESGLVLCFLVNQDPGLGFCSRSRFFMTKNLKIVQMKRIKSFLIENANTYISRLTCRAANLFRSFQPQKDIQLNLSKRENSSLFFLHMSILPSSIRIRDKGFGSIIVRAYRAI
jgi:hypothetical protein